MMPGICHTKVIQLWLRRTGCAKVKSFYVAEWGNPPQYVTSLSWILICCGMTNRQSPTDHLPVIKNYRNHQPNQQTVNQHPPTSHQDIESMTIPPGAPSRGSSPRNCKRSVERAVSTEPQTIWFESRHHGITNDLSKESLPQNHK